MSIEVSERFKAAMKAPVKTVSLEVAFDSATYTSNDVLTKAVMQASGYYFGVATKSLSLSLIGVDFNLMGKTGLATLKVKAGNDWESCVLGRFKVLEQTVDLEKEMTSIKAYDAIGVVAEKYYLEGGLVFPTTVNHLASQLASASGMDYDEIELVNGTYSISEDLYAKINNITYRDILAEVAGASANLAMVRGSDDALNFVAPMMEPVDSLSYDNLKKIKFEPKYGKVSSVVLARTPQEDNIVVVDDDIAALPSGDNLYDPYVCYAKGTTVTLGNVSTTFEGNGVMLLNGTMNNSNNVQFSGGLNKLKIPVEDGKEYYALIKVLEGSITKGSGQLAVECRYNGGNSVYYRAWRITGNTQLIKLDTSGTEYLTRLRFYANVSGGSAPIVFDNARVQVAIYTKEKMDYEPFIPNGIVELKLANNEILDDDRESLAQPILEVIKGFGFTPFEATTEGHGWHEIGDRIRIFNDTPNIPVEYQEVEYLESSGTQYIDTNETFDKVSKVEIEFKPVEDISSSTIRGVFGMYNLQYGVQAFMRNNLLGARFGSSAVEHSTNFNTNSWNNIVVGKDGIYYNGVKKTNSTGHDTSSDSTNKMTIFRRTGGEFSAIQLRVFRLWKSDTLVRDFVPCYRKSDNVAGLYDKVNGVFYTNAGTGIFAVGAKTGVDVDSDSLADVIVTDIKLTIDGGLKEELKGIAPDETQTNYALAGGIKKTIYNTEIKVDKQGQEITSIVSRQDTFEDETLENFTQVVQNISSVVTTIQSTGGGNLIHNSVGYNKDTDGALINWTQDGSVGSETSPESVSYGAISGNQIDLGASSSIVQRIVVDSSGAQKYSLGFKAKKGATGVATVHLRNDIDDYYIAIPANKSVLWESYGLAGVTPHMAYFDVIVETDSEVTDFAISDLILTVGDSNTPWVSASDEILSKSVAVDGSGVTVKSSSNGDYVQLDELGLNGYSDATGSLENVFTVNRDLTEVSKLKARNQITMPPLKIVPVTSGDRAGWSFVKESE